MLHGMDSCQYQNKIEQVVIQCDLSPIINKTISALSKGNRQRVAIAQSMIHQPDILILDEPTSGLDPKQITQFRKVISNLKHHTAVLLSSHIMHEMLSLCDSIAIIHEGKIKDTIILENQSIVIDFYEEVLASIVKHPPQWHSGNGKSHQFKISAPEEQTKIIEYFIYKNHSIYRIVGAEQVLENCFLESIGHRATKGKYCV